MTREYYELGTTTKEEKWYDMNIMEGRSKRYDGGESESNFYEEDCRSGDSGSCDAINVSVF